MPKLDFMEQFQAIGYSMAKKAKEEVLEINKVKTKKIKEINLEFIKKLLRDTREKTENFVRNYETQLNQQISENIKDLNLKILKKKNELFEDYRKNLLERIQKRIKENYNSYLQNMISKIKEDLKIFKSVAYLSLNAEDKNEFNKIKTEFENKKIILEPKTLECIGGYKLSDRTNTVQISNTLEDSLDENMKNLRMNFSKIFPEYIDRRKSATQLMKERNITVTSSIPEDIRLYMLKYDIELPER